jgi:hypothetical protein
VIQRDVISDFRRLADHHAHAVVDEKAPAYGRAGMNLDPGQKAPDMRDQPSQPTQVPVPKPIGDAMYAQRMEARIAGQNLPGGTRGRVAVEYAGDVFTDAIEHKRAWEHPVSCSVEPRYEVDLIY